MYMHKAQWRDVVNIRVMDFSALANWNDVFSRLIGKDRRSYMDTYLMESSWSLEKIYIDWFIFEFSKIWWVWVWLEPRKVHEKNIIQIQSLPPLRELMARPISNPFSSGSIRFITSQVIRAIQCSPIVWYWGLGEDQRLISYRRNWRGTPYKSLPE